MGINLATITVDRDRPQPGDARAGARSTVSSTHLQFDLMSSASLGRGVPIDSLAPAFDEAGAVAHAATPPTDSILNGKQWTEQAMAAAMTGHCIWASVGQAAVPGVVRRLANHRFRAGN